MEVAQIAAATLVVDHLPKVLGAPSLHKSALVQAVIPFYGVTWNRKILTSITTHRPNYELGRLKRSEFPKAEYVRLTDFLLQAYQAHGLFPPGTEEWKLLAERFRLNPPHEWGEIAAVAPFLQGRGASTPLQLSEVLPGGLEALCKDAPSPLLARSLWGISRSTFCQAASSSFSLPEHKSFFRWTHSSDNQKTRQTSGQGPQAVHPPFASVAEAEILRGNGPIPKNPEAIRRETATQNAGQLRHELYPGQPTYAGQRVFASYRVSFSMLHSFLQPTQCQTVSTD